MLGYFCRYYHRHFTGERTVVIMNRAGRKELMLRALARHDRLYPTGCLTSSQLAHCAGLKSSSEVVKMLRELAADDRITEVLIEPYYACGYTVRAWQMAKFHQVSLPDEYIIINGKNYRRDSGEEVSYVRL